MRAIVSPAAAGSALALERVWELVQQGRRTVVVDAPPGSGKSTLVRQVAARLAAAGRQVPIVTQGNQQADDLAYALGWELAGTGAVGRLHGGDWSPPPAPPPNLVCGTRVGDLAGCAVVVATAAKWGYPVEHTWTLGIIDEAYQMSSAALARVAPRFERLLLVGDPGQLEPFTAVDERVMRREACWPLDTAAGTVRQHHPDTPVIPLPVSWRLAPPAAAVVATAFYPWSFGAGAGARRMRFGASPAPDPIGRVLTVAAGSGWGVLELPAAYLPRADPLVARAVAEVAARLLGAEPVVDDERGGRWLRAADVAVGVTHRDRRAQVRQALAALGLDGVTVDTADRLQGREFAAMVVWHPLSGRRDAAAFPLEAGRLCVLASRHRQACVVVTRAGVREQLDACPAPEPVWLEADPPRVDGWEAHQRFLEQLAPFTVTA